MFYKNCKACGKEYEQFELARGLCEKCYKGKINFENFIGFLKQRKDDFFNWLYPWFNPFEVDSYDREVKDFIIDRLFERFLTDWYSGNYKVRKEIEIFIKDYINNLEDEWADYLINEELIELRQEEYDD